jgi:hypothetical protein
VGASITPTEKPELYRLSRPRGAVSYEWKLRATPPASAAQDAHNHSDLSEGVAQIVGNDAFVLPNINQGTPISATIRFDSLATGAVVATSFGRPATPRSAVTARGQLGDLRSSAYTFALDPSALRVNVMKLNGGELAVLFRGRRLIPDSVLLAGVRDVVAAERKYWGGRVPKSYMVSIGVAPRGTLAGVRLTDAFIADIDSMRPMDDRVLDLFAHELMHDWIGGRLYGEGQPEGTLAWFTEGFTEYASSRVIWKAGLKSDSAYIASVNRALAELALSPARDYPWPKVVETYWRDASAQRQPYLRGQMLAMRLEALMPATGNGSFKAVLLRLLAEVDRTHRGVTDSSLVQAFGAVLGKEWARSEVQHALAGGVAELPQKTFGRCATSTRESMEPWDPGFDVDESLRTRSVVGVRRDGPAFEAGLRDGMRLTGADITRGDATRLIRLRVRADTTETRLSWLPAGKDRVTVQQWHLTGVPCR